MKSYLEEATEGSWGTFISVGRLRRRLIPSNLAITACTNLKPRNNELEVPQIRVLLPQHEPAELLRVLLHVDDGRAILVALAALVKLRRADPHRPRHAHAVHRVQRRLPARCRHVLLHYVFGRGGLL